MSPARFEPVVPASERSRTHALDRAATCTGAYILSGLSNSKRNDLIITTYYKESFWILKVLIASFHEYEIHVLFLVLNECKILNFNIK